MRQIQLVGEAYKDESLTFSAQDTVNWLPEPDESGQGRSPWMLRSVPGLSSLPIVVSDLLFQGSPSVATVGAAYSYTFAVIGGDAPYSYTFSGLPAGLTATGGTISGTPTLAGVFSLSVTVTDANGVNVGSVVSLSVATAGGSIPDSGGGGSGGGGGGSVTTQEALIPNAGFESGAVSWSVVARTPTVSPGFVITNTPGYDGSAWVARWEGTTDDGGPVGNLFENAKAIWLDGSLNASVRVRCTAIDPGTTVKPSIAVRSYADAAKTTLISTTIGSQPIITATGTWMDLQIFGAVGPYASVCLYVDCEGGDATLEFDAVEVDAREFITGYVAVPLINGGFESGNTGWTVLNNGPNDSFAIVNEPGHEGAWMLRWTCTGTASGSSIQNNAVARNAASLRIQGSLQVRCTSYGGTPGDAYQEGAASIAWYAYNDRECTDLYASGPFRRVRFNFTTATWLFSSERSFPQPKFFKFGVLCDSNVPITLEIDSCEWTATDTLPQ